MGIIEEYTDYLESIAGKQYGYIRRIPNGYIVNDGNDYIRLNTDKEELSRYEIYCVDGVIMIEKDGDWIVLR